jgi:hypothetical protein
MVLIKMKQLEVSTQRRKLRPINQWTNAMAEMLALLPALEPLESVCTKRPSTMVAMLSSRLPKTIAVDQPLVRPPNLSHMESIITGEMLASLQAPELLVQVCMRHPSTTETIPSSHSRMIRQTGQRLARAKATRPTRLERIPLSNPISQ